MPEKELRCPICKESQPDFESLKAHYQAYHLKQYQEIEIYRDAVIGKMMESVTFDDEMIYQGEG